MDELPPGFTIEPYVDGPCLRAHGENIATACPANDDPGAPWRLCIAPRRPPRYVFLPDEATCRRYMAAWARKWAPEIRELCKHPYETFSLPGGRVRADSPSPP